MSTRSSSELPALPEDQAYQNAYRRARKQVRRLRSWYIHAFVFTCVVGFFWLRYLFGDSFTTWSGYHYTPRMPLGMTLGWGLGLMIHGLVVWGRIGPFGDQWEEKQMKRFMQRDSADRGPGKAEDSAGKW